MVQSLSTMCSQMCEQWLGDVVQSVKCLPSVRSALGLILITTWAGHGGARLPPQDRRWKQEDQKFMSILGLPRIRENLSQKPTQCEHRHRGTLKWPQGRAASGLAVCLAGSSYLVDACLSAGEGECEAQRQLGALEAHIVQEVSDALHDVVKELQGERGAHARCALMGAEAGLPTP